MYLPVLSPSKLVIGPRAGFYINVARFCGDISVPENFIHIAGAYIKGVHVKES